MRDFSADKDNEQCEDERENYENEDCEHWRGGHYEGPRADRHLKMYVKIIKILLDFL